MPDETQTIQSPKRKRRWFQFSLRTFLVLVLAFGVWMGIYVERARKQRKAVKQISNKMGCYYLYGFELDAIPKKATCPYPKWLVDSLGIDFFATVRKVHLYNSPNIDILKELPQVENLSMTGVDEINHDILKSLSRLTRIRLHDCAEIDVEQLRHFANLTSLSITGRDPVPFESSTFVEPLENLEHLTIKLRPNVDLTPIVNLEHLKSLTLIGPEPNKIQALSEKLPHVLILIRANDGKVAYHDPDKIKPR